MDELVKQFTHVEKKDSPSRKRKRDESGLEETDQIHGDVKRRNIRRMPEESIHHISSGQVITSLKSFVKEMIENSLDAKATQIKIIFLESAKNGFQISDNGHGIESENYNRLGKLHNTSKLREFEDLTNISSLGFRGEALSSICRMAKVEVVTRTSEEKVGTMMEIFPAPKPNNVVKKIAREVGTSITIKELFTNYPVRRREFTKNYKKMFTNTIKMINEYALINEKVRFVVCNKGGKKKKNATLFSTRGTKLEDNISIIFGAQVRRTLEKVSVNYQKRLMIVGFISKSSKGFGRKTKDRQYIFFRKRPVDIPLFSRIINDEYRKINIREYPVYFLNIIPLDDSIHCDVNFTPDKRKILLAEEKEISEMLAISLQSKWTPISKRFTQLKLTPTPTPPKRGVDDSIFEKPTSEPKRRILTNKNGERKKKKKRKKKKNLGGMIKIEDESDEEIDSFVSPELQKPRFVDSSESSSPKRKMYVTPVSGNLIRTDFDDDDSGDSGKSENKLRDLSMYLSSRKPSTPRLLKNVSSPDEDGMSLVKREPSESPESVVENENENRRVFPVRRRAVYSSESDSDEGLLLSRRKKKKKKKKKRKLQENDSFSRFLYGRPKGVSRRVSRSSSSSSSSSDEEIDDILSSSDESDDEEIVGIPQKLKKGKTPSFRRGEVVEIEDDDDNIEIDERQTQESTKFAHDGQFNLEETPELNLKIDVDYIKQNYNEMKKNTPDPKEDRYHYQSVFCGQKTSHDELNRSIQKSDFDKMEVVGQFNAGFIIVKLDNDLFIFDQHACDEKYQYEKLRKSGRIKRQPLVNSKKLCLSVDDEMVVMSHLDVFEKNGFTFDVDESRNPTEKLRMTTVPGKLDETDVNEMIALLKDNPNLPCRPSKVNTQFASKACHSAVRIGQVLPDRKMREIVTNMGKMDQPWNCPHGRTDLECLAE